MEYTNKSYWDEFWKNQHRTDINFYFEEILDKYIDYSKIKSYMEIGGAPGTIMAYMSIYHNLDVSTVDFTEKEITENYLKSNLVEWYNVFQEDFAEYDTKNSPQYDLVASWGFVEHFSKVKTCEFINKHKELVAENGYLIIEVPNFRKFMWFLLCIFNKNLIKIHNLEIMDLTFLKAEVEKDSSFECVYSDYYIAMNKHDEYFAKHPLLCKVCYGIVNNVKNLSLPIRIKGFFFPYIVIIARRT